MKCSTENKSIGWFYSQQRKLDFDPIYQRESGAWSTAKKQLFIDSLLNDFDIPKIYLHENDEGGIFDFAVIDGKQRISTAISFINEEFSLSDQFEYEGEQLTSGEAPKALQFFGNMSDTAKQMFRDIQLATTIVRKADLEAIEQLFSRLNDGEPLNNAEKRNARGGPINPIVRSIADTPFFRDWIGYANKRYAHRETACRLLFLEHSLASAGHVPDLNKKNLDDFVESQDKKITSEPYLSKLERAVQKNLTFMQKCFDKQSRELSRPSLPQVYYIWLRHMKETYSQENLASRLLEFIEEFALRRIENGRIEDEDQKDKDLSDYSYLSGQGTNKGESMLRRVEILTKLYLTKHPDTVILSKTRHFSRDEKYIVWMRAGKKCQNCGAKLENFNDFHADHEVRFIDGGQTSLDNAQALCASCNRSKQ